jgi:hypothetical protein
MTGENFLCKSHRFRLTDLDLILSAVDGTLWLTFMGCLKNCANVKNIKWSNYLVTFKCCRGYDLCNEYL